ncbi:MAG TPA: hypothetical protein VK891_16190, partial [Euzebyales bacterium]|nr:hypothetical protein [Euzebyales bacterium]
GSLRALAAQYFQYGQWRRVVARRHPGSLRWRQVAAPVMVAACAAGAVAVAAGVRWGLVPLAVYALAVVAATVVVGHRLPLGVAARLPMVFATMHAAWGLGFLTSPRHLGQSNAPSLYSAR